MVKRQKTKHTATGITNSQEAIDAHKKRMQAKGWQFSRIWCYPGGTDAVNLDYEKPRTTPEPEPKVKWHILNLKAESFGGPSDGAKTYLGGDYTVCEAAQELQCNTCKKLL